MQTTVWLGSLGAVPRLYRGGGDARHKGVSSVFDRAKEIATIGHGERKIGHDD